MKKFFVLFCLSLLLFPSVVYAAMIKLEMNCKPGEEKNEYKFDVQDGFWKFPVAEIQKSKEKEQYSVVIESYNSTETKNEKLLLVGAEFSHRYLLLPKDGVLTIENNEDFPRRISVLREGGSEPETFTIQSKSSMQHRFTEAGNFTLADESFSWNVVSVKVLTTNFVWTLKEGANKRTIPDIAPGSYNLKIYYGTRWIYQEDFMVVQNSVQNFTYKIENGKVVNLNSYSTSID